MKIVLSAFIAFFCISTAIAQVKLSGKVKDHKTGKPVDQAVIFLSNGTRTTLSNPDGTFSLTNLKPGQYDLVVKLLGYDTYSQTIQLTKDEYVEVQLVSKAIKLAEVVVKPDPHRAEHFEQFREEFVGRSGNALQCKMINPELVELNYNELAHRLSGSTDDFLVIVNKALGYRVQFLLHEFVYEEPESKIGRGGYTFYAGKALFEELKGSKSQKRRWERNREAVYESSSMRFFRVAAGKETDDDSYTLQRLERKPNPYRPSDSLIQLKLEEFSMSSNRLHSFDADSLAYWKLMYEQPRMSQSLLPGRLKLGDLFRKTEKNGIYALEFPDLLYVTHSNNRDEVSVLNRSKPYVFFDDNGIVVNAEQVIMEGYWGEHGKMADLLPFDYEPRAGKK